MSRKPIVLFITPVLQYPATGGPYLRIENSIKALSQISELYLYSRVSLEQLGGENGLSFYKAYCKNIHFAPSTIEGNKNVYPLLFKGRNILRKLVNLLSLKIIHINLLSEIPKSDIMDILKVADRINIDLIWLGFGNISYPILKFIKESSNYKVVLDTDSIWSQFILRELPLVTNKKERQKIEDRGRKKEEEERWGTQLADVTTAVSKIDADYYIGLAKDKEKVHIFSNVIDVESYQNIPSPATNFKNPCIYLAGTFWSRSPMEDAARWVIKEVLPLVRSKIPDIHFYIVGSNSDRILSDIDDPGITITGKVPSVLPYLCYANVALVPLRFESGTRFKILEAGACGIPVVSTTLGAEGIPVTHEKDILIANEPSGFSNSIIKLVREPDLAKEMAEKLKTLVQEKYSVASLTQEGDSILKSLKIIC